MIGVLRLASIIYLRSAEVSRYSFIEQSISVFVFGRISCLSKAKYISMPRTKHVICND